MKFSIIMPFYNSSTYIEDAVLSIINQAYCNWELIAVNDGSSDDSEKLVKGFCDPRIKLINKLNGGYVSAVNCGLDYITGEYFLFMGSDDKLFPNLLEEAYEKIKDYTPDMTVFKVLKHWNDNCVNDEIDLSTLFDKKVLFCGTFADFYLNHKYEACFFGLRDTGKIYKKSILKDLRYFGKYGFDADGIFSLLFAHKCMNFLVLPVEGYLWCLRSGSLSSRILSPQVHIDRIENWIKFIKIIDAFPNQDITELDYDYSTIGYSIISCLGYESKGYFLRHIFIIYKYCRVLRHFWFKKRRYKGIKIKVLLNSFFPLSCFFIRSVKSIFM